MIISFAGRMASGKSELAKICEGFGYKKLYFALPLKQLCAEILDTSIDELNKFKRDSTPINLTINEDICKILNESTDIPIETIRQQCLGYTIKNVRHMLQYIGTDLIRRYNTDWHVNKVKGMFQEGENYVIDDVRFPNEKRMIESLGGHCWFITRPKIDNISNHESETSLRWHSCWNKIIINDYTLHYLLFKWETFMDNYEKSCSIRDKEFKRILEDGAENEITPMSTLDMLFLSKDMFTYAPKEIDGNSIKEAKMINDGNTLQLTYNDDSLELIYNKLNIEDIKLFLK